METKHAFLIMAHNEFHLLRKLLEELDDERNDIFLHIDKKTKYVDNNEIKTWVKKSNLIIVPSMKVYWGHISMVRCELMLLKVASKRRHYQYYHLLSGMDFPLINQDRIHAFFENENREFISFHMNGEHGDNNISNIKHYFPMIKVIGKGIFEGEAKRMRLMRKLVELYWKFQVFQEKLGIDRGKKYKDITDFMGEQWFSITHNFAEYVIAKEKWINRKYRLTYCPDRFFIPTLSMNSEFKEKTHNSCLRETDWFQGETYEYTLEDYDRLITSDNFFARKISFNRTPELVDKLSQYIHGISQVKERPLISVIVPCYNVANYLRDCLDSLASQTYRELEILLIDDGSTDDTSIIAQEYAANNPMFKYVKRTNGGLSAARNTGVELSKGEYIAFIDSDDWVDADYIERLYDSLIKGHADISVCGYIKEFEDETVDAEVVTFDHDTVISSHAAMKILGDIYPKENVLLVIACNKLFKKEIFSNNSFITGRIHEDEFMAHRAIGTTESIAVTSDALYHYRIRGGSITAGDNQQNLKHLDYLDALEDRLNYSRTMMYGDLLIYMLYTYYEGMKQTMVRFSDDTINKNGLYRYFRKHAIDIYCRYFFDLDGYQKRDYLKLIISPRKYRNTVISLMKHQKDM